MSDKAKKISIADVPDNIMWKPNNREKEIIAKVMEVTGITVAAVLSKHLFTEKYNQINSGK